MSKLELNINGRIEVEYDNNIYKTQIQDIKENEIAISIPVANGQYLTLLKGEELVMYYNDNNGTVFKFKSRILARGQENRIPLYILSQPYDVEVVQRRNFVRVSLAQNISYCKIDTKPEAVSRKSFLPGLILDLSGGGMRLKLNEKLNIGDDIIVMLDNEGKEILVKGKVMRIESTEDKRWICGVSFEDIDNRTRENIIRMVFNIMRKQRELL